MPTTQLLPLAVQSFTTSVGLPLVGGLLYTYAAGTNTPQATYTDSTGNTPNTNPIVLNARGEASVWLTKGQTYKLVLQDALNNTLWTADNISAFATTAELATSTSAISTALAAATGSSLVGFQQTGTGSVARTALAKMRDTFNAQDFGAKGDGTTDDTAALQAAINALSNGGVLTIPAGTYKITSTLNIQNNGFILQGAGAGDNHDTGTAIVAPCRFLWSGASGGTMVKIASAGTQVITGNGVSGIFFDGNSTLCGIGLQIISGRLGNYEIVGAHCATSIVQLDVNNSLTEAAGTTENYFSKISGYQTLTGDGAILIENGTSSWDCSQNIFAFIGGSFKNTGAVFLNNADSETFIVIKLYKVAGAVGTSVGLVLNGGATASQCARNNIVYYIGVTNATAPVFASGTTFNTVASNQNNIIFLDTANNPNLPSIDTGATLYWGTIKSPLATRSFSTSNGISSFQDASGLLTQSGVSASIAVNATLVITFATPFTSYPTSVCVTPKTSSTTFSATATATQLTIRNAPSGAAATDFYWRVEGI